MSKSKNDIAWEKIFEKYCILDKLANNERISISSTEINQFREARLMTKFDHRSQLPKLFIDHNYQYYLHPEAHMKSENLKLFVILIKMI